MFDSTPQAQDPDHTIGTSSRSLDIQIMVDPVVAEQVREILRAAVPVVPQDITADDGP